MPSPLFEPEEIANFGEAKLYRELNGKYFVGGGTPEDLAGLKEWVGRFFREAASCFPSPSAHPDATARSCPNLFGASGMGTR